METRMTTTALVQEYDQKILRGIHKRLGAQLERVRYLYTSTTDVKSHLYRNLHSRLLDAAWRLEKGDLPSAYETMYGVALGLDGLNTHWWGQSRSKDFSDDED